MGNGSTGKLIIFSAPSGSGKTTIIKELIKKFPELEFSISATSRSPRGNEIHGRDYFFFTAEEFQEAIDQGLFVEWEEVYAGVSYGTLRSEVERIWGRNNAILFDVDVKGGLKLKSIFGDNALSIFVKVPSVDELRNRLECRGTDSPESIDRRVAKAAEESASAKDFDVIVVNDDLRRAVAEVETIVADFIGK